ncbi:glycosyltransferase family 2 protein [Anoxybacillus rupiensis]|uniref:Glycosyltransferase family 2 protein n=1 Tax=Anoxybacteroides rupiense TaxID=311460 RepID=A0ABT5W3N7_9BACL|nr:MULTISPECIES: glycosyltransferase family 2 protein [Anoxybacillus]MBS2771405.1 glycosyltransferase family 2 protein [Anoxybacillus rupiensis]MDE8563940.1 glycosyltransferase family 2 protein [Anoxybacillus rupiensis]OQM45379.1 glycosyltransferase [Anoxybacillus sp. UARK-01]QHC05613.1 glycosyltransferase [Anoxybacillus sp. PDR2]
MKPFVSIVVPTYNRPYPLAELLESLSRQIYRHFEVIIVNDGGERVDHIIALYPEMRIRLIHCQANVGHVEARNIGVKKARGEWIMLCDDDDLLLPCHLERMVEAMVDADFVYSDVEIFHYRMDRGQRIPLRRFLFAYEYDQEAMRKFSTYVPSGSLYRKEIHESIGYFDPFVHNYWDWDFFLRVSEVFRVKRVAAASILYAFSDEGDHLSRQMDNKRQMYLDRLSAKHRLGKLPTKNFWLLLQEPEVAKRKANSEVIWDGAPIVSRLRRKI